jgi:3-hydroxyisobutyrate dehydrogenase-like beta-hydroxyacid dehydrogenase
MTCGFVGFGEAASHIATGLREAGLGEIFSFDIHSDDPKLGGKIRDRAERTGTRLVKSNAALTAATPMILSTVTASQAWPAAEQTAPFLSGDHLYADLNSVSPSSKQSIAKRIGASGARFVEVAVMAPVPPYGHRVPMLAGGAAAEEFVGLFTPFGMRIQIASPEVGVASATKMFRSIMVKGMEALVTECMLAASHYGAAERVLESLDESYPGMDWNRLAGYMMSRVVEHGERRAREMDEVAATLRTLPVDPIMAEATARRMDSIAQLGLKESLGEIPRDYRKLVEAVIAATRKV